MGAQGHEKEVALGSTGSESAGPLCSVNHGTGDQVSQLSATTLSAVPITSDTPSGLAAMMHNLPMRKLRLSADPLFAQVPKDSKPRYLSSWFISPSTLKLHLNKRLLDKRCYNLSYRECLCITSKQSVKKEKGPLKADTLRRNS